MKPAAAVTFAWTTPDASGGVALVWLWGPEELLAGLDGQVKITATRLRKPLTDQDTLRYGVLYAANGEAVDEVLLARPGSGMRVVSGHCGSGVRSAVTACLTEWGFVPAEEPADLPMAGFLGHACPGEHPEADAAEALLPAAVTERQALALLGVREGTVDLAEAKDWLRPRRVVLLGPYNSGKSSLFNRWVGYGRALVTDWAGATLDPVTERIEVAGLTVWLTDLPGLPIDQDRSAMAGCDDELWRQAWQRARAAIGEADLVVVVLDAGRRPTGAEAEALGRVVREWSADGNRTEPFDAERRLFVAWTRTGGGAGRGSADDLAVALGIDRLAEIDVADTHDEAAWSGFIREVCSRLRQDA